MGCNYWLNLWRKKNPSWQIQKHSSHLIETCKKLLRYLHNSIFFSHLLSAVVTMSSSTIPVSLHWLRIQWANHAKVFTDTVKNETSNPQMVTHLNAFTRPNLEFPLGGHHLCIGSCDLDTSVEAGFVVSFNDGTAKDLIGTYTTVVWACKEKKCNYRVEYNFKLQLFIQSLTLRNCLSM